VLSCRDLTRYGDGDLRGRRRRCPSNRAGEIGDDIEKRGDGRFQVLHARRASLPAVGHLLAQRRPCHALAKGFLRSDADKVAVR